MTGTTFPYTSLDSTQRANLDATRNELDSLLERDSLIDIMKIDHASLADVEPGREIALTTSKCLPQSNFDEYTTTSRANRSKLSHSNRVVVVTIYKPSRRRDHTT